MPEINQMCQTKDGVGHGHVGRWPDIVVGMLDAKARGAASQAAIGINACWGNVLQLITTANQHMLVRSGFAVAEYTKN